MTQTYSNQPGLAEHLRGIAAQAALRRSDMLNLTISARDLQVKKRTAQCAYAYGRYLEAWARFRANRKTTDQNAATFWFGAYDRLVTLVK